MEATFDKQGNLAQTGPSEVKTAEGLGGANVKGVDDERTHFDPQQETGKEVTDRLPGAGADVGFDVGSGNVALMGDDQPTGIQDNSKIASGNTTAGGRQDYALDEFNKR